MDLLDLEIFTFWFQPEVDFLNRILTLKHTNIIYFWNQTIVLITKKKYILFSNRSKIEKFSKNKQKLQVFVRHFENLIIRVAIFTKIFTAKI